MTNDYPIRSSKHTPRRYFVATAILLGMIFVGAGAGTQCAFLPIPPTGSTGIFNNTADKTNNNAGYLLSNACQACHPTIAAQHIINGHAHKVQQVTGGPPTYPEQGTRAGVPNPPDGMAWADVSYVIGGYIRKARFINQNGYVMTNGVDGVNTQWNLSFPANGTTPSWSAYHADQVDPKPYDFSCFQCHTTGALPQDEDTPMFQDNRPGFIGTWVETGVQCEECHGPGSNHVPNPSARDIYVDSSGANTCNKCHNRPYGSEDGVIRASGGYIRHHEQWPELQASGGHATLQCTMCHDPHVSVNYDRANAIRNECVACHATQGMALHSGKTFTRGDYTEELSCVSCHMPFATKSAQAATTAVVGDHGRMGDTRSHIFRINTNNVNYTGMFSEDGGSVLQDEQGRAAVTVDFVCLRCHNGIGAFEIGMEIAADIATNMHVSD